MLKRRGFLGGLLAAPLIVRPGLLMPVKAYDLHRETIGDRSLSAIVDESVVWLGIDRAAHPDLGILSGYYIVPNDVLAALGTKHSYDILAAAAQRITHEHRKKVQGMLQRDPPRQLLIGSAST